MGEDDGPVPFLASVDLEEARPLETALHAVLSVADGERFGVGTHIKSACPFAAAVIGDRVDIIEETKQPALKQRFAGMRGDVPPAFGGPAFGILIADGDADSAPGGVRAIKNAH